MNNISNFENFALFLFCSNKTVKEKESLLQDYDSHSMIIYKNDFLFNFLLPENLEKYQTNLYEVIKNFNHFVEKNNSLKNFYLNNKNIHKNKNFRNGFKQDYCFLHLLFKYNGNIQTLHKFLDNINFNLFQTTSYSLSVYNSLDEAFDFKPKKEDFYSLKNEILESHDFPEIILDLCYNHYKENKNFQKDSFLNLFLFDSTSNISCDYTSQFHKKFLNLSLDVKEISHFYTNMLMKIKQDKDLGNKFFINILDSISEDKQHYFDIIKNIIEEPYFRIFFDESYRYIDIKKEKFFIHSMLNETDIQAQIKKRI